MNNLIFCDIETGGFDKLRDSICSISFKFGDIKKTWYVKPYRKNYNPHAMKVHGITLKELNEKGLDIRTVLEEMQQFIMACNVSGENMFIGHNLHFDLGFLEIFFDENGYNLYEHITYHYLDTMTIAGYLMKVGKINPKSLSLINLYKLFYDDNLHNKAHRSDIDVLMTEKVYIKLLEIENN